MKMVRKTIAAAALVTAGLLIGCGTSTRGPEGGSWQDTDTGLSQTGYPGGQPIDTSSPALASSTEHLYSRGQAESK